MDMTPIQDMLEICPQTFNLIHNDLNSNQVKYEGNYNRYVKSGNPNGNNKNNTKRVQTVMCGGYYGASRECEILIIILGHLKIIKSLVINPSNHSNHSKQSSKSKFGHANHHPLLEKFLRQRIKDWVNQSEKMIKEILGQCEIINLLDINYSNHSNHSNHSNQSSKSTYGHANHNRLDFLRQKINYWSIQIEKILKELLNIEIINSLVINHLIDLIHEGEYFIMMSISIPVVKEGLLAGESESQCAYLTNNNNFIAGKTLYVKGNLSYTLFNIKNQLQYIHNENEINLPTVQGSLVHTLFNVKNQLQYIHNENKINVNVNVNVILKAI